MATQEFQVGDRVEHPEFGEGMVLETRGAGETAVLLVSFPDKTQRKLVVRFANLKRLGAAPSREGGA